MSNYGRVQAMNDGRRRTIFTELYNADCLAWLRDRQPESIHAVITDPPYGLVEYSEEQLGKLRAGKGGVWRIPPNIGGSKRQPLPRFTVLKASDTERLASFFEKWGRALIPSLVPGAHVFVASSPLLSHLVSRAMVSAGFEKRGEIIRLVRTLRGGDRPKGAEKEFPEISAMPRSCWEPWPIFRKPLEGTLAENLRKHRAGGLKRPKPDVPFTDVIYSARTPRNERRLAAHPSLKPQKLLRTLVAASLPMREGVVLDPFAGSGSTLAACQALGYDSIGIEIDKHYFQTAMKAIPALAALEFDSDGVRPDEDGASHRKKDPDRLDSLLAFPPQISESKPLSYDVNLRFVR